MELDAEVRSSTSEETEKIGKAKNPFAKSSSIGRTPPKSQELNPQTVGEAPKTAAAKEQKSVEKMLETAMMKIDELHDFASGKHNVHHEIKKMIRAVKSTVREVLSEMVDKEVVQKGAKATTEIATPTKQLKLSFAAALGRSNNGEGSEKRKADENKTGRSPRQKRHRKQEEFGQQTPKGTGRKGPAKKKIDEDGFETVERQKRPKITVKTRAPRRARPDAVIIEAQDGTSNADILRKVKDDPNLKEMGDDVIRVKRTQKGHLLFEMKGSEEKKDYQGMVEKALGSMASVKTLTQETIIVCKDIDEVTTQEEVLAAIREQFQIGTLPITAIKSMRPAYGGTQTAIISLSVANARILLLAGKVKIGWTVCRMREHISPKSCFRCLGYGHIARECKGVDRSKMCRKCGQEGHIAKSCSGDPKCMLCTGGKEGSQNHITGSSRCPIYKNALKKAGG